MREDARVKEIEVKRRRERIMRRRVPLRKREGARVGGLIGRGDSRGDVVDAGKVRRGGGINW